jgi:replicative DNA helicase|tara:strand:- start:953 stop:2299 length:1347 start_codon:yes stop_codon:yes gene_type:complete
MEKQIGEMPSSADAENSVLGCILMDGEDCFDKALPWIRNDDAFYIDNNKKIWQAIKVLRQKKDPIDLITVSNELKENKETDIAYYLSGLPDSIVTSANIENHAKIVWEKYVQREVRKTSYKMNGVSFDKYKKTMPLINKQLKWLEELRDLQPDRLNNLDAMVDEAVDYIKSGENVIKFGMYALDKPAGGMTRKEVTVLGGRPGHGKTTLMVNILKSLIEQGYKVMLFNREMSNTEMLRKLIVLESKSLLYGNIRRGEIEGLEDQIDKAEKTIKKKYKNLIMYDDIRTLEDGIAEISKHKPDIVIDDYIQLITMDDNKDRRFQIEKIMQEYKWVAKKENCSALLLSQLNREIERRIDPYPRMSDYAESGVIEQTVENALFVFYGYNFDHENYDMYESEIISCKTRYGVVGGYKVGFAGNRCGFYATRDQAVKDLKSENETPKTNWLEGD